VKEGERDGQCAFCYFVYVFVCNEGKGVMVRMVKEGGVGVY